MAINGQRYQLEAGELRTFNIENVGDNNAAMGVNKTFQEVMQNAGQVKHDKQLRNLGPSITYKLRDAQARRANTICTCRQSARMAGRT